MILKKKGGDRYENLLVFTISFLSFIPSIYKNDKNKLIY